MFLPLPESFVVGCERASGCWPSKGRRQVGVVGVVVVAAVVDAVGHVCDVDVAVVVEEDVLKIVKKISLQKSDIFPSFLFSRKLCPYEISPFLKYYFFHLFRLLLRSKLWSLLLLLLLLWKTEMLLLLL